MDQILSFYRDKEVSKYIEKNLKMLISLNNEKSCYVKNISGSRSEDSNVIVEKIYEMASRLGLEELSSLTDMDKTTIPVYSARHGNSRFHRNYGKGVTDCQAKISAMMEFIERMTAEKNKPTKINETYIDIKDKYNVEAVRPASLITKYIEYVADSSEVNWVPTINLTDVSMALIPTISVLFPYTGDSVRLYDNNSNGLAAGSTFHEAIIQGIYEVIERDIISLALATSKMIAVNKETIKSETVNELIKQLEDTNVKIFIKYVPNEFNIPCFIVTGDDEVSKTPSLLCGGYGCHSNKEIALIRAITEMIQSRKSLLFGKRSDIIPFKCDGSEESEYIKSKSKRRILFEDYGELANYKEIEEKAFDDLKEELVYLVNTLNNKDMKVYVNNLTCSENEGSLAVVRVIIPGLENWYDTRDRVGSRLYERMSKANVR